MDLPSSLCLRGSEAQSCLPASVSVVRLAADP